MTQNAPYFLQLQSALKAANVFQPTLLIDLDRLNANIDTLRDDLPAGMAYRIVAKSLPCPALLRYIRERAQSDRLMTFNLPMLLSVAETMQGVTQLLGKPLPAEAMAAFLKQADPSTHSSVFWLIDTPERLAEYEAISEELNTPLNIVLELDVGLHRGGFEPGDALTGSLTNLHQSNRLSFAGYMGYEPHIASLPAALGWQDRALKSAWSTYETCLDTARSIFGDTHMDGLLRNAAGSPTYRLYKDTEIANEISVGSALVKPTDFDTDLLAAHRPASFIATPVLKAPGATRIPGLEFADGVKRAIDPASAQCFFIHGGKWMADPVHPEGLSYNKLFGRSSNQEMINGPMSIDLEPGDFIFLRPHQSEAIFLQLGDIAIYQNGKITDWWPTFPISA